jgi:hypothetical protein
VCKAVHTCQFLAGEWQYRVEVELYGANMILNVADRFFHKAENVTDRRARVDGKDDSAFLFFGCTGNPVAE